MDVVEAACLRGKAGPVSLPAQEGAQRVQENGAADRLSEKSDASFATAEPSQPPAVTTGKLKKTAFKLFGGKRSICTLPSFFGGKNKGQGKGVTKKGLSKSKTHDGISDVGYEEATSGHLKGPPENGMDVPSPQLPSSLSLGADANLRAVFAQPSAALSLSSEGFEKKTTREKSLFLPRSKKGLRGFFNSIRRHRKNKFAEPEKTEMQEWAATEEQAETIELEGVETLPSSEKSFLECTALSPEGGEDIEGDASPGRAGGPKGIDDPGAKGNNLYGEVANQGSPDIEVATDGDNSAYGELPKLLELKSLENSPPCVSCNDQLDMLFEDVTSLKSFDSFTGCGDIIAEPDIDSVAESSASAERSKEAIKRSSCLVTYQGGGEEMAMPDEVEEYLQQMWEDATKGDESYERHLPKMVVKGELQGVKGEIGPFSEGTKHDMDLLTPHSDQQESAPNSDEGYYDSATPGPDDEAGDGLEEVKKGRLPRDSYSGDALYEFYEPDDVLMSPSHGEESWLERKVSPPEIFARFFDFIPPEDKDLGQGMGQKNKVMETEEERIATIQKQLLYWEIQQEPALKQLEMFSKDQLLREKQHHDCEARVDGLMSKSPNCLGCEEMDPHAKTGSLNVGMSTQSQDWKDLQQMLLPEGFLAPFLGNGSMLEVDTEQALLDLCSQSGLALEKSGSYPFYRTHSSHGSPTGERPNRDESDFGESLPESGCEMEQAVNFSQALVEFTSSGTLFSSLSESLGSSDSGSAFTQNLPALPTMVTFDIVDVEQDGEGECEQNPEITTDGDLTASFGTFDESYILKESFAECDERMFPRYAESAFQSCNWGMASLPRCLRLQELSPPRQQPFSVCRRSRSLDTESLEFELAGLELSRSGLKPYELRPQWSGHKKGPGSLWLNVGQVSAPCSPEEKEGNGVTLSWPGLQNVSYGKEFSSQDMKPWDYDLSVPNFPSPWPMLEELGVDPPLRSLMSNSNKVPSGKSHIDGVSSLGNLGVKPMARPSDLLLQTSVASHEGRTSHRPSGNDGGAQKFAWVLPLEGKEAERAPSFDFACRPDRLVLCKPGEIDARNVSASQQEERRPL